MIFAMPGCHPVLLLHIIPAAVARSGRPLIPFDTNSVVTGNCSFVLGSLEEATLQRRRGREARWVYFKLQFDRKRTKIAAVGFFRKRGFEGYVETCALQKDRLNVFMPLKFHVWKTVACKPRGSNGRKRKCFIGVRVREKRPW